MENNGVRINKFLSEAGVCSRREADRQVEAGNVLIDGRVAATGDKVCPGQKVYYNGKEVTKEENKKVATGQLDLYNYKLAELAHELDKVNINELTPIEALNILVNMKEKMK